MIIFSSVMDRERYLEKINYMYFEVKNEFLKKYIVYKKNFVENQQKELE